MAKKELLALLRTARAKDLRELLALKKELDELEGKQEALLRQFTSVSRDIGSIQSSFGKGSRRGSERRAAKRRKVVQPSLPSLIAAVLRERKKPLGVNDICDALLQEKQYRTKAKKFKSNVRILLYKNEKGLFRKVAPGRFMPAAAKKK